MASTYVNDLRLNEMATGDASGSWGTITNTNLELIGEALGYGTEGITTNANTHTSTIADGATDPVRALYVEYTGTLDSACTITIAPNTVNKFCFIENGTSGSQNIIIKQGSGATITIPPGDSKAVYLDGAGSGAKVVDAFASLSVVDLKVQDDLTVTGDLDVDGITNLDVVDIDGNLDVDGGTIKLDGNYPNGVNNVALGNTALDTASGSNGYSVAIGTNALTAMTTGGSNVAVGFAAGTAITSGGNNIAVGSEALDATTTGGNNVAVGSAALGANTTASNNTAVGHQAGLAITTGTRNTAVGSLAGDAITTGGENTVVGRNAGGALTTGGTNTFVGADAGTSITTGASNTIIGRNNGNAEIDLRTASNRIVISDGGGNIGLYMDNNSQAFFGDMDLDTDGAAMNAQAVGTAMAGNFYQDDTGDSVLVKMRHGRANSSNSALATMISFCRGDGGERGSIKVNGTGATSFNTSSDYRLKENVDYNWDATTRLKQLKPARFNFIADADTTVDGFLAHEAATVVPDAVIGVKDATHVVANVVLSASDEVVSQGITEESWTKRKADILYKENDIIPDGKSVGDVRKAAKFPSDSKWVATHTLPLNQQIDHSKIVPLLVKTIQELEARITTLEG